MSDTNNSGLREDGLIPSGIQWVKAKPETFVFGKSGPTDKNPEGADQIGGLCEITKGPLAGSTLPWYGFLTEAAKMRTMEQLALAGCVFPDGDIADIKGLGSKEFQCSVVCEETPEGEMRSRINFFGIGVGMKSVADKDGKAALSKKFKGDVMAMKKRLGIKDSGTTA